MELIDLNEMPVINGGDDRRIWTYTISGDFTVASAVEAIREKFPKLQLIAQVWHPSVHPNTASNVRKIKSPMWNNTYDLQVLRSLGMKRRKVKGVRIKEIFFQLPPPNQILMCCDGDLKGNPGISGYGFIGITSSCEFLIVVAGGLGVSTNFFAEVLAILNAGEWAVSKVFQGVCFRTDSSVAISALQNNKIPCFVVNRWQKICASLTSWCIIHSYREVNFSADKLAKKGSNLARGETRIFDSRP
ncbi:uncharacterized protein LOC113272868 [Papaver somniferum]|uniref:uncharacterized protein LOC113272868 n=1 Tax=Papaver somniferum TaxID=3469 RepID=UPI000E70310C|nr:uncharacterized protein LOC113272868 [Papaver somniferum]